MALRNDINAQVKNDLINYSSAIDGQAYILLGETAMGDTPARIYYYDVASTATVDGENILAATGMGGTGRFKKNPVQQINADWNSTSGPSQILNKPTITTAKRQETYSGTSDSSGVYTVTFGTAFSVAPNIQAGLVNQSSTDHFIRVSSVSATGFTVNVFSRTPVTLLGISLLPGTIANVSGDSIDVLVTEK